MTVLHRAVRISLAALFVIAAVPKLAGAHSAVTMFGQIGAADRSPSLSAAAREISYLPSRGTIVRYDNWTHASRGA